MLETKVDYTPISMISEGLSAGCLEVSRLLAAAVINPGFCQLLLNKPELAIKNGFQGEVFLFTKEECEMIASIRADSLSGLAKQLARIFFGNSHTYTIPPIQPNAVFRY